MNIALNKISTYLFQNLFPRSVGSRSSTQQWNRGEPCLTMLSTTLVASFSLQKETGQGFSLSVCDNPQHNSCLLLITPSANQIVERRFFSVFCASLKKKAKRQFSLVTPIFKVTFSHFWYNYCCQNVPRKSSLHRSPIASWIAAIFQKTCFQPVGLQRILLIRLSSFHNPVLYTFCCSPSIRFTILQNLLF